MTNGRELVNLKFDIQQKVTKNKTLNLRVLFFRITHSPYVWITGSHDQSHGLFGYRFKKREVEDIVNNISSYLKDVGFDIKVEWYKDSVYIRF